MMTTGEEPSRFGCFTMKGSALLQVLRTPADANAIGSRHVRL
jgi:hypothetical protein